MMPAGFPLLPLLNHLPDSQRRRLAGEEASRRVPGRHLAERLLDPERIRERVASLPPEAAEFLRRLLYSGGQAAADRVHELPDAYRSLNALADTGLVYLVRADYYRMLYVVPQEFLAPLWRLLADPAGLPVTAAEITPRTIAPAPAFTPFWADLLLLLGTARWEPLPLTQQATVYKRAMNKLVARSSLARDRQRAAVQMELVLRFAISNRLVFKDLGDLSAATVRPTAAVPGFLALPPARRWDRLLDFAAGEDPTAGVIPQVTMALAASQPPEAWIDLNRLDKWLRQVTLHYTPLAHLPGILDTWTALDLWEWSPDRRRGRLSDLGYAAANGPFEAEESGRILCQPTGELMVPPVTPALERWQLEEVAWLERPDRVSVYRLDLKAVERAIDGGYTLKSLLDFFQGRVQGTLPQNVVENLRDWYAALTRHRLMEVMLVHSAAAEDSRRLEQALGDLVVRRLTPTDLIVPFGSGGEIVTRAHRAGIAVRSRVEQPSQPPPADRQGPDPEPLWRLRPAVSASLPHVDPRLAQAGAGPAAQVIATAIKHHRPLLVQYVPPGSGEPVTEVLHPLTVTNDWLQAYGNGRRMVSLLMSQIIAVAEPMPHGPGGP